MSSQVARRFASAAVLVLLVGCGGDAVLPAGPPPKVPAELVPPTIGSGRFLLIENTADKTRDAFKPAKKVPIGEGRLWEVRDADRLIGTLQVTTLLPKVDLGDYNVRQTFVGGMLSGAVKRLDVNDVLVYATKSNDKVIYLWFGRTLYQVMQLKGDTLDPESILEGIVSFQIGTDTGTRLLIHADEDEQARLRLEE